MVVLSLRIVMDPDRSSVAAIPPAMAIESDLAAAAPLTSARLRSKTETRSTLHRRYKPARLRSVFAWKESRQSRLLPGSIRATRLQMDLRSNPRNRQPKAAAGDPGP